MPDQRRSSRPNCPEGQVDSHATAAVIGDSHAGLNEFAAHDVYPEPEKGRQQRIDTIPCRSLEPHLHPIISGRSRFFC
jgi:hypothetical protein